jgi:rod shape-determining protein MreD
MQIFQSSFFQVANYVLRMIVPYTILGLLFILNTITIPYLQDNTLKIPFILMTIYYWSIYRPTMVPLWLVTALGLAFDLLTFLPAGLHAVIFILAQRIVVTQRRYLMGQSFIVLWIGFSILNAAAIALTLLVYGVLQQNWIFELSMVFSWAIGCFAFPLVHVLMHLIHRILPTPEERKSKSLSRRGLTR